MPIILLHRRQEVGIRTSCHRLICFVCLSRAVTSQLYYFGSWRLSWTAFNAVLVHSQQLCIPRLWWCGRQSNWCPHVKKLKASSQTHAMTVAQQHPQRHCQRQPLPRLYHAWRVPVVLLVLTLASGQLAVVASIERRPLDGVGNNVANPTWGSKSTPYLRYRGVPNGSGGTRYNAYADGLASPARATQPNARNISNSVLATKSDVPGW